MCIKNNFDIRPICSFDGEILFRLHQSCFENSWSLKSFNDLLNLSSTVGFVCPFGFILGSYICPELEILTLCVLPEHRGQGIASLLFKKLIQCQAIDKIFLEVSETNLIAQNLYKKIGFVQTGIRKNYYQTAKGSENALCFEYKKKD